MSNPGAVVIVGGTRAIGLEVVRHYAALGRDVVLTGQSAENVAAAVADVGGSVRGITFDLAAPETISAALADVGPVDRLALVAIDRDQNSIDDYSIEKAIRLVTLKLVGYTAVVSALRTRLSDSSSIVLFGGMAKERPYPGSTTVTTVNGGVVGLTRTLVEELRPIRVNSIHPGVVGDTPYWSEKPAAIARYTSETPIGRLAQIQEIVDAVVFLLENGAVNGVELIVDGGWHCR
ncbi:MAG TPA: SDR family oxidoreductase [Candidatus Limnocylindrales bacterium]|jgi:NAD(P)-dependent dehydrogenase (short-subunit alcohol dehydrogenase family)